MIIPEFTLRTRIEVIGGTIFRILGALQPSEYRYLQSKEKRLLAGVSYCSSHYLGFWILGLKKLEFKMQLHFLRFKDTNQLCYFFNNRQI